MVVEDEIAVEKVYDNVVNVFNVYVVDNDYVINKKSI